MRITLVGPFQVNYPFATEIVFSKGLRSLGHEVIEWDPNIGPAPSEALTADFTLVFKTALGYNEHLKVLPNVVLYQPDDLRFPHIRRMVSEMREYSRHLILFRDYAELPEEAREFSTVSSLPVTADPDIYYPEEVEKDYDFCFVGSMGDVAHMHRRVMMMMLEEKGFRVLWGSTNDVSQIRNAYARSRVVVNHASDLELPFGRGYGYQCRHFEVGMTRSCLLSNRVLDDQPALLVNFLRFDDAQDFLWRADWLINGPDAENVRRSYADALYREVMEHHSPTKRAFELVRILESL